MRLFIQNKFLSLCLFYFISKVSYNLIFHFNAPVSDTGLVCSLPSHRLDVYKRGLSILLYSGYILSVSDSQLSSSFTIVEFGRIGLTRTTHQLITSVSPKREQPPFG